MTAEPTLREDGVDDDERGVQQREPVRGGREREPSRLPRSRAHGESEKRLLPRGDDVETAAPETRVPQLGEHEVVDRKPDDERGERKARETGGHVIATNVRPRFTIRTGTGKSARSSAGPRSRFSFAHGLRARS